MKIPGPIWKGELKFISVPTCKGKLIFIPSLIWKGKVIFVSAPTSRLMVPEKETSCPEYKTSVQGTMIKISYELRHERVLHP